MLNFQIVRSVVVALSVALLAGLGAGCSPSAKKARHLNRADKFYDAGRYEQAEIEYLNARKIAPTDSHAIGRLGLIYYEQGRFGLAYPFLIRAREMDPENLEVRLKTGYIHLALNQTKEAHDEAAFILERNARHAEAPLLLAETARTKEEIEETRQRLESLAKQVGEAAQIQVALGAIHFRQGDFPATEAACQRALTLDPKSGEAHYVLGNLFAARNDLQAAEQAFKTAADLSPPRSFRRLKYADFKIQTGKLAEAKEILEQMTATARDYLPAWMRRAEIALGQRDYEECDAFIKQILTRDASNFEALILRGRLRLVKGEYAQAVEEFQRLATLVPRSPQVHHQLGIAHLGNGDTTKAISSLNQAVTLNPNFDEAVLLLAQLNLRRGDHASAITAAKQLIGRRSQLVQARLVLADAYRAQGNFGDALAEYQRLEEMYPQNPQWPVLRGLVLGQQNKREEARQAFEKSLEIKPGYVPALERLVGLDLADGQSDRALSRVRGALSGDTNSPALHLLLASVHHGQRDFDRAEADCLKAIELNPNSAGAYMFLATVYVDSKQNEKALEKLKAVLARNPKDTTALLLTGMIQAEKKEFAAARAAYETLLSVKPTFSPALNNLACLYSEQFGLLEQAHDLARRARETLPGDAAIADTLGWILYKRGEYRQALGLLQESAEKLPGDAEVQFHLGMTCYMLGDEAQAGSAIKRALALNKEFHGREEAGRRLALLAIDEKTAGPAEVASLERRLKEQRDDPVALARLTARYEREGALEKAVNAYEDALKANPKNVFALVALSRLHARLQHRDKALELAKEAYKLAPEDRELCSLLGRLVFDAGDHNWAVSLLEQGARTDVPHPQRLYELGEAYYCVGRISDAERTIKSAMQSGVAFDHREQAARYLDLMALAGDPARAEQSEASVLAAIEADGSLAPALMAAAVVAERRGDPRAACDRYEQLLRLYPNFVPANKRLAVWYAREGADHQKAYDHAMKARSAYPNDGEVAKALGMASYWRGDYRRAAQLLKESERAFPQDGEVLFHLGMSHHHLKEKAEAQVALRKAVTLNDKANYAAEANRALAELQ